MAASKAAALPLGDSPTGLSLSTKCFPLKESMVRSERLELSHLAAPEPKSGASTNSATTASCFLVTKVIGITLPTFCNGRATWIRTREWRHQKPLPYRLAIALQVLVFQLSAFHLRKVMVRSERLELSHLAAPEPKSGASTNSATTAL